MLFFLVISFLKHYAAFNLRAIAHRNSHPFFQLHKCARQVPSCISKSELVCLTEQNTPG